MSLYLSDLDLTSRTRIKNISLGDASKFRSLISVLYSTN